jgi:hypothetical protein
LDNRNRKNNEMILALRPLRVVEEVVINWDKIRFFGCISVDCQRDEGHITYIVIRIGRPIHPMIGPIDGWLVKHAVIGSKEAKISGIMCLRRRPDGDYIT